ncbi:MFS transporter [Streptomyces griseorubiginosus]|uniref:MFS transporter n=1 Tax=Streptomyces griseorubiginosus TaxID=67304 RepID=UPI0011407FD3|nr:MFS transporter [Streptomyces griseorubiginosus]
MTATTEARSALTPNPAHPGISRKLTLLLAVATGVIAANLYYAQPLPEVIARSLGTSSGAAGAIVTVPQLGFAAGLMLVLPLSDMVKRRSLLSALLLLDAAALAMVGLAPGFDVALAAYAVLGLANVAAQLLVPAAAQFVDDAQGGRAVATVISGLLTSMLLARTVSGLVTECIDWRPPFLAAAVLMSIVNVILRRALRDMDVRGAPVRRLAAGRHRGRNPDPRHRRAGSARAQPADHLRHRRGRVQPAQQHLHDLPLPGWRARFGRGVVRVDGGGVDRGLPHRAWGHRLRPGAVGPHRPPGKEAAEAG